MTEQLTTQQVTQLVGVSRRVVHEAVATGKLIVASRGARSTYLFDSEEVARWQAARSAVGTQEKLSAQDRREQQSEAVKIEVLNRLGVDALSRDYDPVVRWATSDSAPKSPGTPMLFLSDVHWGERVNPEEVFNSNKYDRDISRRRLQNTFEKAVTLLTRHFVNSDFPGIVLVLGGDMINGSLHEDSLATDEVSPVVQALEMSEIISDGVAFLADNFPNVDIYCVPGNHGRTTRKPYAKFYAHNNLDWLCYKMVQKHITQAQSHGRLTNATINAPNARDLTFTVAGRRYRLTHGDQFRGGDGFIGPLGPITRGDAKKRVTASLMPGLPEAYDTLLCGHFHRLLMLPQLIVNGSVKGYDEFALSIGAPWEPPQQALWTVHPKYGQNWYMPILCEEK